MDKRTCLLCGADISFTHALQRYCSKRCQNAKKWAERPRVPCVVCGGPTGWTLDRPPSDGVTCRECQAVRITHGSVRAGYKKGCRCDECRGAVAREAREYQRRRREDPDRGAYVRKDRPRAPRRPCVDCGFMTRSIQIEPRCKPCGLRFRRSVCISRNERYAIYERDGWVCGICGESVEGGLPNNDPWQATLDHIIPRALGGSDDPDNLRLAHRYCNSVRSSRAGLTIEELAS